MRRTSTVYDTYTTLRGLIQVVLSEFVVQSFLYQVVFSHGKPAGLEAPLAIPACSTRPKQGSVRSSCGNFSTKNTTGELFDAFAGAHAARKSCQARCAWQLNR